MKHVCLKNLVQKLEYLQVDEFGNNWRSLQLRINDVATNTKDNASDVCADVVPSESCVRISFMGSLARTITHHRG